MLAEFWKDESGATVIEYGLLAVLISVAMIASATNIGVGLSDIYDFVGQTINAAL